MRSTQPFLSSKTVEWAVTCEKESLKIDLSSYRIVQSGSHGEIETTQYTRPQLLTGQCPSEV